MVATTSQDPQNLFDDLDDAQLAKAGARWDDADLDDASNPNVMRNFYQHLFPWRQLFLWLNSAPLPSRQWTHREFAFTLQNDAYLRYNSFAADVDLKKEVLRLIPSRFEIGPVYSAKPKDRRSLQKAAFRPVLRELVFDIDMTDYDSVRTCCSDKKICTRCWQFIAMAVKVLDRIFRDDFGFKHLLWVYSGRRGIHCWISDAAALSLTDEQRKAIVNYIDIIKGGAKQDKKVNLPRPLHPSVRTSLDKVLKDGFVHTILEDQDCFRTEEGAENLLKLLPEKDFGNVLREQWKKESSMSTLRKYNSVTGIAKGLKSAKDRDRAFEILEDVVLQYTYPRIDTEVSKHLNHLLKSPFCVHPGTGRVCVPLSLEEIARFEPEKVPTVGQLLREIEARRRSTGDTSVGWEVTSLKPYVDRFQAHVDALLRDGRDAKKAASARNGEF